jgi:outer membrane protein assembly factor BamA
VIDQYFDRVFADEVSGLVAYPFSITQRFELGGGYTHIGYDRSIDRYEVIGNTIVRGPEVVDLPSPDGLNLFQANTALVGDNSYSGFTSPVYGYRYRVDAGLTTGSLTFGTLLADFRKYFFWNPLTLAMRGYHYGRYGPDDADERLTPLFLGYDVYVRGYSSNSFDVTECSGIGCPEYSRLLGSRIVIGNVELRLPLFGTSSFGLINFPYLPLELVGFFDGGVAWSRGDSVVFKFERNTTDRVPVFSTGISARANILNYLILEVYYAFPFQRPEKGWHWGFSISPGW